MSSPDAIIQSLRKYFPEQVFQLSYDADKQQYMVIRNMVVTNKKTRELEEKDVHCLEFAIEENRELVIKLILNCSIDLEFLGRGKDIVERIVRFSNAEGYTTKIEYDVSKISVHGIEFSLRKLKLLGTGQTWYQSLGFFERNYEENHRCIADFIDQRPKPSKPTIREHYSGVMQDIQVFSKKEELTEEERTDLKKMSANIDRKFRELEKKCPATNENFYDLYYRTPISTSTNKRTQSPSTKSSTRSRSASASTGSRKSSPKTKKRRT